MTIECAPIDAEVVSWDSPAEWVRLIKGDLQRATEGIIAAGVHLAEAKAAVGHGEWLPMLEQIGISQRWAHCLMSIGGNPAIANQQCSADLPQGAQALYELSRAPAEDIEAAIESGRINPSTTAKQAKEYVREVRGDPPPPPPPDPMAEAELLNAVRGVLRPDRLATYSPRARQLFELVLTQALADLKELQ